VGEDNTRQSVRFAELCARTVVAEFDQHHGSSDGGAILLKACDARLGLSERLIGGIDDRRQVGKIRRAVGDLVRQRLYAIACGCPDGNDASRLGSDPIQKLLCGRDPVECHRLARGHRHPVAAPLAPAAGGVPGARLRVRLDGGYASAELFALLERENLEYVVAMAKNKVLARRAARLMGIARRLSRQSNKTEHVYGECGSAARTWPHRRRMLIKAEVVRHPGRDPRKNPRFVVTNLKASPRHVYEAIYCARGDVENRIQVLHHDLEIDRANCHRFLANQLRGLLTAATYVLFQELCLNAAGTAYRHAQVGTLPEQLLKLGARVQSSVRRIVLHLQASSPCFHDWQLIAHALGAAPA
jgi:hypothetical protein